MHGEFFRIVMEHHQIAELSDQFFFVRLDLNLHLLADCWAMTSSVRGERLDDPFHFRHYHILCECGSRIARPVSAFSN